MKSTVSDARDVLLQRCQEKERSREKLWENNQVLSICRKTSKIRVRVNVIVGGMMVHKSNRCSMCLGIWNISTFLWFYKVFSMLIKSIVLGGGANCIITMDLAPDLIYFAKLCDKFVSGADSCWWWYNRIPLPSAWFPLLSGKERWKSYCLCLWKLYLLTTCHLQPGATPHVAALSYYPW